MAKDFAFMFYPGDYLRDTQCLSEKVQVAYDRIMCEHMRNICISQAQLNFFTKKLNIDEKEELDMVLTKVIGGFQIDWVVKSINQRLAYSESRSKNKKGKGKKDVIDISISHDIVMEDEDEIEDINTTLHNKLDNTEILKNKNGTKKPTESESVELSGTDLFARRIESYGRKTDGGGS